MPHALVIGGTGMLAETCIGLCAMGYRISAAGRNVSRHQAIIEKLGHKKEIYYPVIVDYTRTDELTARLSEAIQRFGIPSLVITWIHSHAKEAHNAIAALAGDHDIDYFHVRGSTDPRHLVQKNDVARQLEAYKHLRYHQVILGFALENGISRWLTDQEISRGVLEAVRTDAPVYIVGMLEPFSARPQA